MTFTGKNRRAPDSNNNLKFVACDRSIYALIDAFILFAVICACGFLLYPLAENSQKLARQAFDELSEQYPILFKCFALSLVLLIASLIGVFCFVGNVCGRKGCRGLRNSPELDIWFETEGNVMKSFGPIMKQGIDRYRELVVELKKVAPANGKAVLVFRSRCGCPVGKLEVAGEQRGRRIKK